MRLLVTVTNARARKLMTYIASVQGVTEVDVHDETGSGCCCQHCPWNSDHRTREEKRMPVKGTPADQIIEAIKSRRADYEDSRENEAYISGLKQALSILLGIDEAHRLLQQHEESYW